MTHRRIVLMALAKVLPLSRAEDFSLYIKDLATPGVVDVTGWSDIAVVALCDACRTKNVRVVMKDQTNGRARVKKSVRGPVSDERGVHFSSIPN